MSSLQEMKEQYDNIPIPDDLSLRVQQAIAESREKQPKPERLWVSRTIRGVGTAAAAACVLFTVALNTVPAFAAEVSQLPVLGPLARVLTFRSYETEQDEIAVSVEIPSIEVIRQDTGTEVDAVNQEILNRCREYEETALARAEAYRTAFLETGGTLEQWAQHNIRITVGYEIKHQDGKYLSFVISGSENWSNANPEVRYYNLDLNTGAYVTLRDLLGDNYETLANESIRQQIRERETAGEVFFPEDMGGFTGITEYTKFYINANHNPVVVFEKYEIANGSAGEIEFEIGG